jgi:hypothetical protein
LPVNVAVLDAVKARFVAASLAAPLVFEVVTLDAVDVAVETVFGIGVIVFEVVTVLVLGVLGAGARVSKVEGSEILGVWVAVGSAWRRLRRSRPNDPSPDTYSYDMTPP